MIPNPWGRRRRRLPVVGGSGDGARVPPGSRACATIPGMEGPTRSGRQSFTLSGGPAGAPLLPSPLEDPALYINRELSWLEFNQRVLDEALDPGVPLLERLKFLCICASN